MGTARAVMIGEGRESVRVEYVKTRAVLRVRPVHPTGGLGQAGAVEVPLADLTRAFGIGLSRADARTRFLLFGADTPVTAGGAGDLLGVYLSEDEARARFHQLRSAGRTGWAELVVVNGPGAPRPLCWFGRPHLRRHTEVVGRKRWLRRRQQESLRSR